MKTLKPPKGGSLEQLIDAELKKVSPFPFNPMEKKAIKDGAKLWLEQKRQNHVEVPDMVYFIQRAILETFDELLEELKQ